MILTVTPNPCVDKTVFVEELAIGEIIRSQRTTCVPGGKGCNVSRAVHALGRPTRALALVGGQPGRHVVDMIRHDDGGTPVPVWIKASTRTITTILEEPAQRQTPIFEPGPTVTQKEADAFFEAFLKHLPHAEVATFNGSVPDPILIDVYGRMIEAANEAGVYTILDSHGPEFLAGLEAAPHMVKPNRAEAEEAVGYGLNSPAKRWQALEHFIRKGVKLAVLSLGERGILAIDEDRRYEVTPPKIEAVNAVGSGDALVAGFAVGLLEHHAFEDMARLGVAAGTANAMSWDIGHFTRNQVEALLPKVKVTRV